MDPLHFFYIFKFLGISDEFILLSQLTLSNQVALSATTELSASTGSVVTINSKINCIPNGVYLPIITYG